MGKDKRTAKRKCKNTAAELKELFSVQNARFYINVAQKSLDVEGNYNGYIAALSPKKVTSRSIRYPIVTEPARAVVFESVLSLRTFIDTAVEPQPYVTSYKIERLPF